METPSAKSSRIFIASSHREPRRRRNHIAPTAYAFTLDFPDLSETHWGFGGAREAQEMLAQGLNRAAERALIDDDEAPIEVIVRKIGFRKYLTDFIPKWHREIALNPGFSRNNISAWKRLHNLSLLSKLTIRLPSDQELKLLEDMQELARSRAAVALAELVRSPERYEQAGVFVTDEDAQSVRVA